jgi:tRNA threonylcarbamoyladenosine biosynthesis protein TsaB
MILTINTAQETRELTLVKDEKSQEILAKKTWPNEKNDVEKLVPYLQEILKSAGLNKSDITEIVVVNGPGPYTALRIGITFANALAEGLNVKLYTVDPDFKNKKLTTNAKAIYLKDPVITQSSNPWKKP